MWFMNVNGFNSCELTLLNSFVPLNEIIHDIHAQREVLVASWIYIIDNWLIPCRGGYSEMFLLYSKLFHCTKGVTFGAVKVFYLVISLVGHKPVKKLAVDSFSGFILRRSKSNQRLLFWSRINFEH